jgi:hypothetical protein
MQEKAKAKTHEISWAYRLSQRLHLLKRDEIEVTATPEQCLQHLEKIYAKDIYMDPFETEVISNYKGYDVIVRSVDKSPKGGEAYFIWCRLEGKGDNTIVSLEVSLGKMIFENLFAGFFAIPILLLLLGFFSVTMINRNIEFFYNIPGLLLCLTILIFLLLAIWVYPLAFLKRNEMLEHIVTYMFRIEEKLASQHPLEETSTPQSTHPAADSELHADPAQAGYDHSR